MSQNFQVLQEKKNQTIVVLNRLHVKNFQHFCFSIFLSDDKIQRFSILYYDDIFVHDIYSNDILT